MSRPGDAAAGRSADAVSGPQDGRRTTPPLWRPDRLDDALLDEVVERLRDDAAVNMALPGGGRLYLDRPLPFLMVYRRPVHVTDPGTRGLVRPGPAHMIVEDPSVDPRPLVRRIGGELAGRFGGFLLMELWAGTASESEGDPADRIVPPAGFRICAASPDPPDEVVAALVSGLSELDLERSPEVDVRLAQCSPAGLDPLLTSTEASALGLHRLGLEVDPIYRDARGSDVFPVVLRGLATRVDRALKQAAAAYAASCTTYRHDGWRTLGRTRVADTDWEVDRRLTEITDRFDFLLDISPVNADEAWDSFRKSGCRKVPRFRYRPLRFDPEALKARLYSIPIEDVDDPTLGPLFRQQRAAIAAQLTMLEERNTPRFFYGSMHLYGGVADDMMRLAEGLLAAIEPEPPRPGAGADGEDDTDEVDEVGHQPGERRPGRLDCHQFAERVEQELEYYRGLYSGVESRIEVRDDISGVLVSRGNVYIGEGMSVGVHRVEALVQHEVGTHVVTYVNGSAQPLQQLFSGLAGYDELQEGLAVLAEYLVGGLTRARLRLLAARVLGVRRLEEKVDFLGVWEELTERAGLSPRTAFTATMRIFRGGGLTKDAVYLRGLVRLLRYLENGGRLDPFFVGKITPDHAADILELQARGVLMPAPLRPRWMEMEAAARKLERCRDGMSVVDLVPRRAW